MDERRLEILILGAGAIGSVLGEKAQGPRARVTAVCRSNYEVVKRHGVHIRSLSGELGVFRPDRVVRNVSEVMDISYDYVVLATKSISDHTADPAIDILRAIVRPQTILVSVQNGVTSELSLRQCFDNPILSAICYLNCSQSQPGVVEQLSLIKPHAFYIGKHSSGQWFDCDKELDDFVSLDDSFAKVADARKGRWTKLAFNAAWNSSAALLGKDTHELLQDPKGMELVRILAEETVSVGRAMGVNLANDLAECTVQAAVKIPPIVPSMLQDLRRGRPLEVEPICAIIVRYGRQYGVHTPVMELTYKTLSAWNERLKARRSIVETWVALGPDHGALLDLSSPRQSQLAMA